MRLPLTAANFFGCGSMRWSVVIADPFDLRATGPVGPRRAAMDMHMGSAGSFEDPGRRELAVWVRAAHPQQRRAGLECGLKVLAVVRGGVIVEELLQRNTTETGADQRCDGKGDRSAR